MFFRWFFRLFSYFLQFNRMCSTVSMALHSWHMGSATPFRRCSCVSLVWPILRRAILTCSGRVRPALFLLSLLCSKVGCTEYRWLSFFLFQSFCHWDRICSLLSGSRSVCGIAETSGSWAKALFAAWSAFSFPVMPMWLGSQQKITSFLTFLRSVWFCWISLIIELVGWCCNIACKQDLESEKMMNFLCPDTLIQSRARVRARASAVKMLALPCRAPVRSPYSVQRILPCFLLWSHPWKWGYDHDIGLSVLRTRFWRYKGWFHSSYFCTFPE